MACEMGLVRWRDFSRERKVQLQRERKVQLQRVGSSQDVPEVFCKLLQR